MRPEGEYQQALQLIREGINDCEVGRRLGIPRGTIRAWRVGLQVSSGGRTESWSGRRTSICFRCDGGWIDEEAYWKHWLCVFPQHGPGRKHDRLIRLQPWQERIVEVHPKALIRGLIHSDGNRHINPITRRFESGTRHYRYLRYMFKNASDDILTIFTEALDVLGIHWTKSYHRVISVARREDVAFLDTFVGAKR